MSGFATISGLILVFASVAVSGQKPMVTVYYESLCTDSIRFVTKQLFPSYTSPMRNHYDLKLVPFGKAKLVSGNDAHSWRFECHHGERECYGNKVHGCALEKVHDLGTSLKFIVCLMKKTLEDKSAPYPVEDCARQNQIRTDDIIQCANYTEGVEVLKRNQEETDRFRMPLSNVPTVAFNNKLDKEAVDNFAMAVCKHIDNPPHECMHMNAAATSSLAVLSLPLLAVAHLLF